MGCATAIDRSLLTDTCHPLATEHIFFQGSMFNGLPSQHANVRYMKGSNSISWSMDLIVPWVSGSTFLQKSTLLKLSKTDRS